MGTKDDSPLVSSRSFVDQGSIVDALAAQDSGGALEVQSPELAELGVESKADLMGFWSEWNEALQSLDEATEEAEAGVMVAPQNRIASILQSQLAAEGGEASLNQPLNAGGLEVKFGKDDWWGWFKSVFKWNKTDRHPLVRPTDATPGKIDNQVRIAVFGDWATNLYGAPEIAKSIKKDGDFQVVMHLGDVYYSGTNKEAAERLLAPWPHVDGAISRTLNANHDMYAGGHAYFGDVLPALGQKSSYFALQNDHWTLIALDTGYDDFDLDTEQTKWVYEVVSNAGNRNVVLFSHHQLFSRLSNQGSKLAHKLSVPLSNRRIHSWYWGHEHRCVAYEPHPFFGLRGRCIGHGGMPEKRKTLAKFSEEKDGLDHPDLCWRRLDAKHGAPSSLILDGPNEHIAGEEDKFLPHGYVALELDGKSLTEVYYSAEGKKLLVNELGS